MTETWQEFTLPSKMQGAGGGRHPSFEQLAGRLVHILPTGREDNVTTDFKKTPHTRLSCDLTFFDGPEIGVVTGKDGQVKAQLTPAVQPGQTMTGRFVNQDWFVSRLKDKVGQPGFPGIVGVLFKGKSDKGNDLWMLQDPSPQQLESVKAWFMWKASNPGQGVYTPSAPVTAPPAPAFSAAPMQQQAPAAYAAPAAAPFAQPQQVPAATPFAAPPAAPAPYAAPAQPAAAPVAQPGAEQPQAPSGVQPWQR